MTEQQAAQDFVTTADETPDETTETETPNAEAARYRRQLRDVEAERDSLRDALAAARKREVGELSGLAKPDALWAIGLDVHQFYDTDGSLNRELVAETVANAKSQLGLSERPRTPRPDPSVGKNNGYSRPSFADAFRRGLD